MNITTRTEDDRTRIVIEIQFTEREAEEMWDMRAELSDRAALQAILFEVANSFFAPPNKAPRSHLAVVKGGKQ